MKTAETVRDQEHDGSKWTQAGLSMLYSIETHTKRILIWR